MNYTENLDKKMNAREKTKYHLIKSIKEIMQKKPLDQITIQEIVSNANITRQTFYRHFKDKYDLVTWYFEKEALKNIYQIGKSCSLKQGLSDKFRFMKKEKVFFMASFKSKDANSLIQYDMNLIYKFYKEILIDKCDIKIDDDIDFLLRFYSYGAVNMIVRWVNNGMDISPEDLADKMIKSFPDDLKIISTKFNE